MVPDLNADVQRPVVQYSNGGKGFIGCFHHNVAKKRARSHHSMLKLHCIIPIVDTVDIVDIVGLLCYNRSIRIEDTKICHVMGRNFIVYIIYR